MKLLFSYALKGLLFIFPLAATGYILYAAVNWTNNTFNSLLFEWMSVNIPMLGVVAVFLLLSFTGWLVSKCMAWPAFRYVDDLFRRMPIIKIIYTSVKELTEAFVGDERKFNIPVVYKLNDEGIMRFGFITQNDLSGLNLEGYVTVYSPHSYNFSGNLYLVPEDSVQQIDVESTEMMKFIISAGVTDFRLKDTQQKNALTNG